MTNILMDGFKSKEFKVTIFRLPMVYGPGDHQYPGRHGDFIERIIDGRKDIVLSDREQCQIYTYGYVENIASAITFSFDKEICNGKIYNLGETKSRSRRKWAELYAKALKHKFDFHILPEELIRKDKNFRNAPPQHLLTDSSLYCAETGFTPKVPLNESIQRTFDFAKENPQVLGEVNNYEIEDNLIKAYYEKLDQIHEKMGEHQ